MNEGVITDAARTFLDVGIVGALALILMGVIVWQARVYRSDLERERAAHQRTREAQIEDIRNVAKLAESVREQLKASEAAIAAVLDALRGRDRG